MAKRQTRKPTRTSDPDMGATTDTASGMQGDEVLDASTRQTSAEASDRGIVAGKPALTGESGELTYDDIAARAYDLWVRRGHAHGSDFEDWLEAERELREERRRTR